MNHRTLLATVLALAALPGAHASAAVPTAADPAALLPLANATRLGDADAGRTMTIGLGIEDRDAAGRAALVKAMYDPTSAQYHRFLTPAQYAARFGPDASQTALATGWLSSGGLKLAHVASAGDFVAATGTVSQIEALFGTTIGRYEAKGVRFLANDAAPQVPTGLDLVGVLGLNTLSRAHTAANVGGTKVPATLHARDLWSIYDQPDAYTGQGQSLGIMIMGRADTVVRDLRSYESSEKLPTVPVDTVPAIAGGDYSDDSGHGEWILDTQSSTGMAPNLDREVLYQGQTLTDTDQEAAFSAWVSDATGPRQANASFGECETTPANAVLENPAVDPVNVSAHPSPGVGTNAPNALEPVAEQTLQQGVMQGKTLFASTGDTGSSCPAVVLGPLGAANGVGNEGVPLPNYPAASPYAVAVGGTVIYPTADTTPKRSLEYAWPYTGGGQSFFLTAPNYQQNVPGLTRTCLSEPDGTMDNTGKLCRGLPDVAAESGDIATSAYAIVDDGDPSSSGGTSLSSPLWAGMWSRIQSASPNGAAGDGFANPSLYRAGKTNQAKDYYDITVGANGAYTASSGWDYVSGWGAPDLTNLLKDVTAGAAAGPVTSIADTTPAGTTAPARCGRTSRPAITLTARNVHVGSKSITLKGTAHDVISCGKKGHIKTVAVAIARRQSKSTCRFLLASGKLGPTVLCTKAVLLPLKGRTQFRFARKVHFRRGHYIVTVTAVDSTGHAGVKRSFSKFPKSLR